MAAGAEYVHICIYECRSLQVLLERQVRMAYNQWIRNGEERKHMADRKKNLRNGEIGVTIQEEDLIWRDRKRIIFGLPWSFTVYKLTPSRIIIERGFLNKRLDEIRLYRVTDLQYHQTFGNRIFGLGSIKLFSSDASLPLFDIVNIKKSRDVKEVISQAVEVARRENGVRTSELVGNTHMGPPPAGEPAADGASLGPAMFPDYNHDGIDDRLQ